VYMKLKGRNINTKPGATLGPEGAKMFSVSQKHQFGA
jgi:hypothetical protein